MGKPRIFELNHERPAIVAEVVRRVVAETREPLITLNEAAFLEIKRLEGRVGDERALLSSFRDLARSVGRMNDAERRERVRALAERYAWDVAGNFDPRVYRMAAGVLPTVVSFLTSPLDTLAGHGSNDALARHVTIQGPVNDLRSLAERGTIVFVPTHLSNFDSVAFAYGLEQSHLPPATYGAGKNLFTNPLLTFFMHNLGAYRVDRRIKHSLYKSVLKAYSCVLIERGYHSLFFPGGTRSRSGGVEEKLKLGLAGTGLEAFVRSAHRGAAQPVFFVPATLNYLLTLEARTLVDDYLAEIGRSRYIIEDDESTQASRVLALTRKLLLTEGSLILRFGDAVDPFGNRVDAEGRSYDGRGRAIDPLTYVQTDGVVTLDGARDAQYTRELGEVITRQFSRNTVLLSTHLVAGAAFGLLRAAYPNDDLFTLLRRRDELRVPRTELSHAVGALRDRARELEDQSALVLAPGVRRRGAVELMDEALRAWSGYHHLPILDPDGDGYRLTDTRLLFYYQNRLVVSGLGYRAAHGASATASGGAAHALGVAS